MRSKKIEDVQKSRDVNLQPIFGFLTFKRFAWFALVSITLLPVFLVYDFLSGGKPILSIFARPVFFEDSQTLFRTYGDQVYYLNQGNIMQDWRLLPDADANSFVAHNVIWASDEKYVFRRYEKSRFSPDGFGVQGCYVSDGSSVYYVDLYDVHEMVTISNDAENFELIPTASGWLDWDTCKGKDSNAVYFWHRKVEFADPATFRFLNHRWSIDAARVFVDGNWAEGLSSHGLHPIGDGFASDGVLTFAPLEEPPFFEVRDIPE